MTQPTVEKQTDQPEGATVSGYIVPIATAGGFDYRRFDNCLTAVQDPDVMDTVAGSLTNLQTLIFGANQERGWWTDLESGLAKNGNDPAVFYEKLALIHSELSEALEGFRKRINDTHLSGRAMVEVELADTIVRILDLSGGMGLNVGAALAEKIAYNARRKDHSIEERMKEGGKKE